MFVAIARPIDPRPIHPSWSDADEDILHGQVLEVRVMEMMDEKEVKSGEKKAEMTYMYPLKPESSTIG